MGVLEDGADLQKAIIDIYTKCRTVDEINHAFDLLQEQYKDVIDESMKKTKQDLLDYFDEDLQEYFADMLNLANKSVSKVEETFWRLTKNIIFDATFDDELKQFTYLGSSYSLSKDIIPGFISYSMNSDLGLSVLEKAGKINDLYGNVEFDISNYPYKITNIEELKGKSGYIVFNKLKIESFEDEEILFFNGILDDGTILNEDTISKLFRLETVEKPLDYIENTIVESLVSDSVLHSKKIIIESEERNNEVLNNEIEKINKWAEDKIEATQLAVEMMRNERKNLQKQSDLVENSYEKKKIEEEILKLSKKIKKAWLDLADAEEEIEEKRKNMINKLRKQLMKKSELEQLFIISFKVV